MFQNMRLSLVRLPDYLDVFEREYIWEDKQNLLYDGWHARKEQIY